VPAVTEPSSYQQTAYQGLLSRYWTALGRLAPESFVQPAPVSAASIAAAEGLLGFSLPPELKLIYSLYETVPMPIGLLPAPEKMAHKHTTAGFSVLDAAIEIADEIIAAEPGIELGPVPRGPFIYLDANESLAFYLEWPDGVARIGGLVPDEVRYEVLAPTIESMLRSLVAIAEAGMLEVGVGPEGVPWVDTRDDGDDLQVALSMDLPADPRLIWLV
jgi:hypothetical protein